MSDFRIFSDYELMNTLSIDDLETLEEFRIYLTEIRRAHHKKQNIQVSLSSAYITAWELEWVDFQTVPIKDLFGCSYGKHLQAYRKLQDANLDSTARIKWLNAFNGLIPIPKGKRNPIFL